MFPLHIRIGDFFMPHYEGAYFAITLLIGLIIGMRVLDKAGKKEEEYGNLVMLSVFGALVFGRIFHMLFWNWEYFISNPIEIFFFWKGGISITGGIFGAMVCAYTFCKIKKISFFEYLALLAPVLLLGQSIGRIGCFLNGDAFGMATTDPWGVSFPRFGTELFSFTQNLTSSSPAWLYSFQQGLVSADSLWSAKLHPTQLYEIALNMLLLVIIIFLNKKKISNKIVSFVYMSGYALFRFFLEYFRGDKEQIVFANTSMIQIVLFCFFLVGSALITVQVSKDKKNSIKN